jgi:hypothetical protein
LLDDRLGVAPPMEAVHVKPKFKSFVFKVERSDDPHVLHAIAAWKLAWAERVVLGEIEEDGMTTIAVYLSDDWETGPKAMQEWVAKMTGPKEKRDEA